MAVIAVIPARFASTRFPGKPLSIIHDKPMIQWVHERVSRAKSVDRVIVATDDERIRAAVESFGGECRMTSVACQSGTDRVAEVAGAVDGAIFVNVQGDEPLIEPEVIDVGVDLVRSGRFRMGTLATPIRSRTELENESVVKVILDRNGGAIYFSRFPIPHSRGFDGGDFVAYRHLGLYVYRKDTLQEFSALPSGLAEARESLEQLRALENGIQIGVAVVHSASIGVDRPEDIKKVLSALKTDGRIE